MLDSPRPVPGPIGAILGRLGEPFYALVVGQRNAAFDRGAGVQRAAVPVASVGNLSVGGTGKTPIVAWLVRALAARGLKPAVAMRGYMPTGAAAGGSDEAREYAAILPGVPILVNPDRAAAIAERLAGEPGAFDAVVLDDGFQHRRLHRDVDVVLIDATRNPFADRLLPAGWLREPVASLRRAQAVVLTHAEAVAPSVVDRLVAQVRGLIGRGPTAVVRHEWGGLEGMPRGVPGDDAVGPVEWLKGKRLMVACAIGNPWPFVQAAQRAGEVREQMVLRDHDPFAPATVERMMTAARRIRAEAIVVTGKDWTKLSQAAVAWPCPVLRPVLRLRFDRGEQELARMVAEALGKAAAAAPGPTGT